MRFMMMIKAAEGAPPSNELYAAVGQLERAASLTKNAQERALLLTRAGVKDLH